MASVSPELGAPLLPPAEDGGGGEPDRVPASSRRRSTLLSVCPFILGNEFCERLAFYG